MRLGLILWFIALVLVVAGFIVGMIFALKNQKEGCVVQAFVTGIQHEDGMNIYTYSYMWQGKNYTITAKNAKKYDEGDQVRITIDTRNPGRLYEANTMMIAEYGMWAMIAGLVVFTIGIFFI